MKNKKVLITGGSGFIGSHLTKRLVNLGADVSVTVKYKSIIDNVRLSPIWNNLNIIEADLRNTDSLKPLSKKHFDIVFHLAAYNHVGDSFIHVNESLMSNAIATANLLESDIDFGRLVYTATSEIYGYQENVPFNEDFLPFPISPYAIGKYSGELYARMKNHENNMPIVFIRPFNTFGPYQSDRAVIPELIIKCLKNIPIETTEGKQTREFNYVDNIVDGFIAIGTNEPINNEPINVGSNHEIPIAELVKTIHKLCESESELRIGALENRPTEIWRMSADNTRASEILGWEPKVSFEDGLKITIDWFKDFLDVFYKDSTLNKL